MGDWSIELGERPLNAPSWVKHFVGQNVAHSFIRVLNDKKEIELELHGLYSSGIGAIFSTAAEVLTHHALPFSHLHVLALASPRLMKIFTAHSEVTHAVELTGSEDTILRATECMLRAARQINEDRVIYYFDLRGSGETCQSASTELLRRVDVDASRQKSRFERPGLTFNLEEHEPALKAIGIDRKSPLSVIKKKILDEVASMSPDLEGSPLAGFLRSPFLPCSSQQAVPSEMRL
jgi:hypothetical protein